MKFLWSPFRDDLIYFRMLCEEKNLSRTADRMGVSQPQVSKAIKKLEEQVAKQLFVRRAHGVEMTLAGSELLRELDQLETRWWDFRAGTDTDEGLKGHFTLGLHSSIAMNILPELIHPLIARHAELELQTFFVPSLHVTQKVADLQFDFGFVVGPVRSPELVIKKIRTDYVALWKKTASSTLDVIYYHPEMIHVHRLLKKFSKGQVRPLADYQVIAEICSKNSDAGGLLPSNIAEQKGLSRVGERLFEVPVHLIVHKEKLKSKSIKNLFSALLNS